MARDLSAYNVSEKPCYTCPFGGKNPIPLAPDRLAYYYDELLNGGSQHLCHSAEKTICRGGRTIQLRWFCLLGIIEEPTDEAFNQAVTEVELKRNKNDKNGRNNGKTENISETH
ncbi:hypothetical protein [Microcoleus asticus]|uniref:Uncharacterized protein n=1 Tax=Microcoleus asticus IPMA8 TaxID=2563858 RepID=A0ABX2D3R4_9CYAN|nr:hypothetical protein [Microcoleus asticus]NQE37282.1 hypothetical protein [Microcoleus asticus IPMA8]